MINMFILHLKERNLADTTINTYMSATRAFFYFAMREGYLNISEHLIRILNEYIKVTILAIRLFVY
ncbi:site-specific integrase [Halalkalibacter alkalisediminis]|uniref:Site-specific integrase n=1 Tax=Halalkalibacter alkalisediminis TaxID=935616 RepID=A0ABV6NLW1_9BACI